jgi:hypothetical protein
MLTISLSSLCPRFGVIGAGMARPNENPMDFGEAETDALL